MRDETVDYNVQVLCWNCQQEHSISKKSFDEFGSECPACIQKEHERMMKKLNARGLGLTCVKGCGCGFGE